MAILNSQRLLQICQNNRHDVADLLREGIDSANDILERLRIAAARGESLAVQSSAHELKGLAGTIGGEEVAAAAARCEDVAKRGDIPDGALMQHLVDALWDLVTAAKAFEEDGGP